LLQDLRRDLLGPPKAKQVIDEAVSPAAYLIGGMFAECDPFGTPSTSHWTGAAIIDSDDGRSLFVEGCVRNQSKFYVRFNAVVLLSAPAEVILGRVAHRTTNNYGKTPLERAMILDDLARVEPLLRDGCTRELDASRPLDEVVADLIAIASRPMTTS